MPNFTPYRFHSFSDRSEFSWMRPRPLQLPTPASPAAPVARPDPLAVSKAEGVLFKQVDRFSVAQDLTQALARGADVPSRVQDGPTCGLYALGMVMDFWDDKDEGNLNPMVQRSDVLRWDSHTRPADDPRHLLDLAQELGFTTQGEMFFASQLGALAEQFDYQSTVHENITAEDIKACVDRGHPALIGFDVDNQGNPGLFGGKRAHWAVIQGHFEKDGETYFVAAHGWNRKEHVWKASDFMASVNQLDASDFPGAPADITATLKGRLVEIYPSPK